LASSGRRDYESQRIAVRFGRPPDRLSGGALQALAPLGSCFLSPGHSPPEYFRADQSSMGR
jgi:hypothetical protein